MTTALVVAARVADLVDDARRRVADADPGEAFFGFLARLGAEGATKRDFPDAITIRDPLRDELHQAMAVLLHRGQDSGAVRPGITVADVVALLKGLLTSAHDGHDPSRMERILAVVIDGCARRTHDP